MIVAATYKERLEFTRDVLAAYSALDHRTTAEIASGDVHRSFSRVTYRLSALVMLHGVEAPGAMLSALSSEDMSEDPALLISKFLEQGGPDGADPLSGELQQEIVHFSRIVDIDALGLAGSDSARALSRLDNSARLPESMKVLSQLMIVARSRLVQWGIKVEVPRHISARYDERDLGISTTVVPLLTVRLTPLSSSAPGGACVANSVTISITCSRTLRPWRRRPSCGPLSTRGWPPRKSRSP